MAQLLLESGRYNHLSLRQMAEQTGIPHSTLKRASVLLRSTAANLSPMMGHLAGHTNGGIENYQAPAARTYGKWGGVRHHRPAGIYFAGLGPGRPIRIGRSADIYKQLTTLQANNPEEVFLLGWLAGDEQRLLALHTQFAEHHLRGEWFAGHPNIESFIKEFATNG